MLSLPTFQTEKAQPCSPAHAVSCIPGCRMRRRRTRPCTTSSSRSSGTSSRRAPAWTRSTRCPRLTVWVPQPPNSHSDFVWRGFWEIYYPLSVVFFCMIHHFLVPPPPPYRHRKSESLNVCPFLTRSPHSPAPPLTATGGHCEAAEVRVQPEREGGARVPRRLLRPHGRRPGRVCPPSPWGGGGLYFLFKATVMVTIPIEVEIV